MRPYWSASFPDSRRPKFGPLRGQLDADVVVVGGGLTGCTVAAVFAGAGVKVVLLEAERIGEQATAGAPGLIVGEPGVSATTLQAMLGRRRARAVWEIARASAGDFARMIRRLGVRPAPQQADLFHYLPERADARELERERTLRADIGLDGQWQSGKRANALLKTPVVGALRAKGWLFDPYRACVALARAAGASRAQIFEKSAVTRIRDGSDALEVSTARGMVTARRVVVATGGPTRLFPAIARRFASLVTYRVATESLPAAMRRDLPGLSAALVEATCPAHLLRWTDDNRLLFSGVERLRLPERSRPAALVQHSAQLMYELSLLYPHLSGIRADFSWDSVISASDDGLPYIGPHRRYPRHLFALGAGRSDGSAALLAARILLRHYLDASEKTDALFGFGR